MDLKILEKNYKNRNIDYAIDYRNAYKEEDVIMIAVGTPERSDGSANLDYVKSISKQIPETIEKDCLVVIKSTVLIRTKVSSLKKYISHLASE